jgi:hypothetical protein
MDREEMGPRLVSFTQNMRVTMVLSWEPICRPLCSDTMPTLKNGFGLPTFAKGSVPGRTALKNEPGKDP